MLCEKCKSENVYFSKKRNCYVCEDCGNTFAPNLSHKLIFISYAHNVFPEIIDGVVKSLRESHGLNVWIDASSIKHGEDWRRKITKGIQNSTTVVAFLSEKAIVSPGVCLDELQISVTFNKHIIPIRLQNVIPPSSISYRQWYDVPDGSTDSKIRAITEHILFMLEHENNMSEDMAAIENALHPTDFTPKLKLISAHEYIKREWLLKQTDEWLQTNKRFLWICGKPGTGKSIYSGQIYFERPYVGSIYFCEWDKHHPAPLNDVIRNLAFQLALRDENYRELLCRRPADIDVDHSDPALLFDALLTSPFNIMIDGNRPVKVFIIDALDELEPDDAAALLHLIYSREKQLPRWIKFIFTTRPAAEYRDYLNTFHSRCITFDAETAKEDIKNFAIYKLKDRFIGASSLGKIAAQIAEKSDGVFLYAEAIVNDISTGVLDGDTEFPSSLNVLFFNYFERIIGNTAEFQEYYSPMIATILAARRNITPRFLSNVLRLEDVVVHEKLKKIRDYFVLIGDNDDAIIKPYHKSIVDWLMGLSAADKYYCDIDAAKQRIVDYGLYCVNTETYFDDYYTEFFYTDLFSSSRWSTLTHKDKIRIYLHLIKSALLVGNIEAERKMLSIMEKEPMTDRDEYCSYLTKKLHFESRHDPERIGGTVREMTRLLKEITEAKKKIALATEIATGLFYAGENYKGMKLMEDIEREYSDLIGQDEKTSAEVKQVYGLLAHDIDKNLKVIESSQIVNEGYRQFKGDYDYLVSLVNLYDGYMGAGQLKDARDLIRLTDEKIKDDTSLQVKDIHYICKGNVLLTCNRVMTALAYYEKGLKIAKSIEHNWDYTYGKIWRELALAYYGERTAAKNLAAIHDSLHADEYKYLKSLAGAFYFVSLCLFDERREPSTQTMFDEMKDTKFPGHRAIVHAAAHLLDMDCEKLSVDATIKLFLRCEGIKGGFTVADSFSERFCGGNKKMLAWTEKFIRPIFAWQQQEKDAIVDGLDKHFRVHRFCCRGCGAMCCYDGVYLSPNEEAAIKRFMREHQEFFADYPAEIAKDECWENLVSGKKTITRPCRPSNPAFPAHFNQTMCIFSQSDGTCALQSAATALDMHPWKLKPVSCWLFPLDADNGRVLPPPKTLDEDPNYIPGKYDGYVSALPCGQYDREGVLWTDVYFREIEYYHYLTAEKGREER